MIKRLKRRDYFNENMVFENENKWVIRKSINNFYNFPLFEAHILPSLWDKDKFSVYMSKVITIVDGFPVNQSTIAITLVSQAGYPDKG